MADKTETAAVPPATKRASGRILACAAILASLSSPAIPSEPSLLTSAVDADGGVNGAMSGAESLRLDGEDQVVLDYGLSAQERNGEIPFATSSLVAMPRFASIGRDTSQYSVAHRCLSQAIYYEAATEPLAGQRAVAQVVLNRVRHGAYPSTVCGVVYEGWNAPVCQFSFVCDGSLRRAPGVGLWRRAQDVARDALAGHVQSEVGSATHYHADYVLPRWAFTLGKVTQIGAHIFYRFPGRAGSSRSFMSAWRGGEYIPNVDRSAFAVVETDEELAGLPVGDPAALPQDPTDRRAPNDIGGRLNTATEWRLEIPMPGESGSSFDETVSNHESEADAPS